MRRVRKLLLAVLALYVTLATGLFTLALVLWAGEERRQAAQPPFVFPAVPPPGGAP